MRPYISVDIEASGPTPGKYSMLSFGACPTHDLSKTFYAELKPISGNYMDQATRIGCLGLNCLDKNNSRQDPTSKSFDPAAALAQLRLYGQNPALIMKEFSEWLKSFGDKPIFLSDNPIFDGMFVYYYFDNFYEGENPFGFKGYSISSLWKGLSRNLGADDNELLPDDRTRPHNSLDDAMWQAKQFNEILKKMKKER